MSVAYISLSQFQYDFLQAPQPRKTAVAGRGSGKTFLIGQVIMRAVHEMPCCKIAVAGPSYKQLKEVVLPQCAKAFEAWGVVEHDPSDPRPDLIEYVRYAKTIPTYFERAYTPPDDYANCYAFSNGAVVQLLSFVKPEKNRGYDFDLTLIDESAKFLETWLTTILIPCNRGNKGKFNSTMHRGIYDFTSGAWHPEEQWVYKTEELAKKYPDKFYYAEATALDNPAAGHEYVEMMRLSLDPIEFAIEVMNERMTRRPDGFYQSLNPNVHLLRDNYDIVAKGRIDYKPSLPLCATLDFNVDFTSLSVIQQQLPYHYVCHKISRNLAKEGFSLPQSVALDFVQYYQNHEKKVCTIYGDPAGKNRSAMTKRVDGNFKNMFDDFADVLRANGWVVKFKVINAHPKHLDKHRTMDEILLESKGTFRLRMSQRYAYSVYISMQNAPIDDKYRKVKVSETKNISQEFATHYSDGIDYYCLMEYGSSSFNRPLSVIKFL